MSRNKEASSRLHEKHQVILADLLRDEDNKYCADCMAKGNQFVWLEDLLWFGGNILVKHERLIFYSDSFMMRPLISAVGL